MLKLIVTTGILFSGLYFLSTDSKAAAYKVASKELCADPADYNANGDMCCTDPQESNSPYYGCHTLVGNQKMFSLEVTGLSVLEDKPDMLRLMVMGSRIYGWSQGYSLNCFFSCETNFRILVRQVSGNFLGTAFSSV